MISDIDVVRGVDYEGNWGRGPEKVVFPSIMQASKEVIDAILEAYKASKAGTE